MEKLFVLLGVLIIFAFIFGLMFIYYRSQQSYRRLRWKQRKCINPFRTQLYKDSNICAKSNKDSEIGIELVPRPLQKRLLLLLHGDRQAAARLLSAAKDRNPSKSIQWCAEKVIFDLQRDYGKY